MVRSPEQIRALFDRWAESYDRDTRQSGGLLAGYTSGYADSLQAVSGWLPVSDGAQVLDVGIGTGAFASLVEARGGSISGIDISEQMLAQCRAQHPAYRLQPGEFLAIPFEPARFDLLISSFAFHEVAPERRHMACAEMYRVLKPLSLLCLVDIMFASAAAVAEARQIFGPYWDDEEIYPLIGELDGDLRLTGFKSLQWQQVAPAHWAVLARKDGHDHGK